MDKTERKFEDAWGITREQYEDLSAAFDLFDLDGNQTISIDELQLVLKALGQVKSHAEIKVMIREVEAESDQELTFNEFMRLMSKRIQDGKKNEELLEAFHVFAGDKPYI
jgi:calmodulin